MIIQDAPPLKYYYQSLSLCVIDAVFSIGVTYTSTRKTVIKYCDFYGMKRIRNDFMSVPLESEQESMSQLIDKIEHKGIEEFTRFLETTLNRKVHLEEAQRLLSEASEILKVKFPSMTPRILDHQIWRKMSLTK